jgi:two-component system cell cycle sensor histidine kinase/response regulator CckA
MAKQVEARQARVRKEADQRRRVLQTAMELSATLGADFFRSIVRHLATTFEADCAYLGELAGTPANRITTLAVFRGQEASQNFDQSLVGSASGQVLSDGSFACSRDAKRLFPEDDLIQNLDAEGYIGIRLSDSAGQIVGLLAMVSKDGYTNIQVVRSVLEVFVPRAAAELERKRSDDMRRQNEERHQAFISANPDAMWRVELEQPILLSLTEEEQIDSIYRFGYLAECNDALAKLAGAQSAEELVGSRVHELATLINPGAREELRSAIRSGFRSTTVETAVPDRAGGQVYRLRSQFGIVEEGGLRRIWGTTRDITDLRRTELSLAASERRFREVLEGIQLPAVMLDLHGTITFANECFLLLAQRSREELSALTWLNGVVPAGESEKWKAALLPDERGRVARFHFEGAIVSGAAPPRVISWDAIGLYDQDNHPAGLAAIGRDITRQLALEMEIRRAEKLESIGRVAAGVAHDFNSLLTVILMGTTQLLQEAAKSGRVHESLSAIEDAATRCARLTGQLLAFARQQHLRPQLINLNDVIAGDERIIRILIGAGIELVLDLGSSLRLVYADPTQIQRALANLATNARDAMPQGGKVTVATSNIRVEADDAEYPGMPPGSYVRLSVSDTGIGLTEEIRAHLFEPFFTTKEPGKGTGLGLSTVYGIVKQGGGHMTVHGEPGNGTRFDIILPVARDL